MKSCSHFRLDPCPKRPYQLHDAFRRRSRKSLRNARVTIGSHGVQSIVPQNTYFGWRVSSTERLCLKWNRDSRSRFCLHWVSFDLISRWIRSLNRSRRGFGSAVRPRPAIGCVVAATPNLDMLLWPFGLGHSDLSPVAGG